MDATMKKYLGLKYDAIGAQAAAEGVRAQAAKVAADGSFMKNEADAGYTREQTKEVGANAASQRNLQGAQANNQNSAASLNNQRASTWQADAASERGLRGSQSNNYNSQSRSLNIQSDAMERPFNSPTSVRRSVDGSSEVLGGGSMLSGLKPVLRPSTPVSGNIDDELAKASSFRFAKGTERVPGKGMRRMGFAGGTEYIEALPVTVMRNGEKDVMGTIAMQYNNMTEGLQQAFESKYGRPMRDPVGPSAKSRAEMQRGYAGGTERVMTGAQEAFIRGGLRGLGKAMGKALSGPPERGDGVSRQQVEDAWRRRQQQEQDRQGYAMGTADVGIDLLSDSALNSATVAGNAWRNSFSKGTTRVPGKTGDPRVDKVDAKLVPGEAVLNVPAAEMMGRGLIKALNALGRQKMGMPIED
jgi:hypothetical protein